MADEKSHRQIRRERGTRRPPELDDPKYDTARLPIRPIGGGTLFWRRKEDRFVEVPIPPEWRPKRDQERRDIQPLPAALESQSDHPRTEPAMAAEKSRRQTWRERGTHRPPELDDPKYDTVVVEIEPIGGGTLFWRRKKDRFKELTVWRAQPRSEDPER